MAKVMNVVFGIGIAVLIFILVLLGIQVFYKEPNMEAAPYNCSRFYSTPMIAPICNPNMTVEECQMLQKTGGGNYNQTEADNCYQRYNEAEKVYGKNVFIITNIVGIILIIISLFLLSMTNIAAGIAFSGLALIVYGFMRGWLGTGDILKFVVALIVTVMFIIFAVRVQKK